MKILGLEKTSKDLVVQFFGETSATYDRIIKWTTFGRDYCWKKEILEKIPKNSKYTLDLVCGTGILTRKIS